MDERRRSRAEERQYNDMMIELVELEAWTTNAAIKNGQIPLPGDQPPVR